MIEINGQEYYALVAPDGNVQFSIMEEQLETCIGLIKLMHSSGLSKSYAQLMSEGYDIKKVRLTLTEIKA